MAEIAGRLREEWGLNIRVPELIIGQKNLIGLDGQEKMSKSLGNAIFFSDSKDQIARKVDAMAFQNVNQEAVAGIYLRALGANESRCASVEVSCKSSETTPLEVKDEIIERLEAIVAPIRTSVSQLLEDTNELSRILRHGCEVAGEIGRQNYENLVSGLGLPRY